jgi:multidrug efflux pump subunit AcrB
VRENGKRRVSVTASVTGDISATEKNEDVEKFADSLNLPEGYSWQTGGVNEENERSVQSILQAMLLSFLLILVTMVIEFGSFRQTLIALLIIPLSIPGVFYVFALTGTPLSFPALIGILALFGIVVTHAIVVIEKINDNRKHGMGLHDSLVDAAGSRLEPVLLTSLTTIVGLIPITLSNPLWRGLGGAIIAGLLFSGAIKLLFVPVVYYNWFHEKDGRQ